MPKRKKEENERKASQAIRGDLITFGNDTEAGLQDRRDTLKPVQKSDQNGFVSIFITTIFIFVAALALTGSAWWYVKQASERTQFEKSLGPPSNASPAIRNSTTLEREAATQDLQQHRGWKTFGDIQTGYGLQYPPDWVASDLKNLDGVIECGGYFSGQIGRASCRERV